MASFRAGGIEIGNGRLTIIAGPCLAESSDICESVCSKLATVCHELDFGYIFKASFDKANRTSGNTARGLGIESGLDLIASVAKKYGVPCTTDVHLPEQCARAAKYVDLLQIPAFLCRQTDLLQAAAETKKPVNVKKGQFLAPGDTKNIVAKLEGFGANGIMLTERGTTFGYNSLIVDFPALEIMRSFNVPVCFDATHSAQRPGALGESTGGARDTIPAMTRAAIAVGIDALFIEVHPAPSKAHSDSETQWPLNRIVELLEPLAKLQAALANR